MGSLLLLLVAAALAVGAGLAAGLLWYLMTGIAALLVICAVIHPADGRRIW